MIDRTLDVPDPYYAGQGMFDEVLVMIESGSRALFRQLEPAIRPALRETDHQTREANSSTLTADHSANAPVARAVGMRIESCDLSSAQPLSPLDGRYFAAVGALADYLSEAGLNRAAFEVEVE